MVKKLGIRLLSTLGPVALFYKGLQFVTKLLREASQAAIAYDTALFRLEVSVRAAQRVMGDAAGTIEQWRDAARTIAEKYGLYTETAMIEVAASVRRMTLQFGLAADQAIALTDAGVALATVFGEAPGGITELLARFVTTGQNAEGLARLGFNIDSVALQAASMRMGFERLYRELSDTEQQQVRYNLVLEQTDAYAEDAAAALNTLEGEIRAQGVAWNETVVAVGDSWAAIGRASRNIGNEIKQFFAEIIKTIGQLITTSTLGWMEMVYGIGAVLQDETDALLAGEGFLAWEDLVQSFVRGAEEGYQVGARWIAESIGGMGELTDEENAAAAAAEAMGERMRAAFVDLRGVFADLALRIKNILREIDEEYARDILKVNEELLRERQTRTEDYAREEERETRAHLLRMRRMEEDYLLELEDAVRARDARQVLLLMRRHRIDERRGNEDATIRQRQRREDFQLELRDMAEQANRRLRELELEWRDRRRVALEEHRAYALQQIEQWRRENDITAEGLAELHRMLADAFGPGGWEVTLFDQAVGIIDKAANQMGKALSTMVGNMVKGVQAAQAAQAAASGWGAMGAQLGSALGASIAGFWGGGGTGIGNPYKGSKGYQTGGDFVATGPRTIRVGEGRPEAVSIRPFSGSGAAAGGQGGGGRGKMEIDLNVKADPRLIVEATEAAMSEVADVFINITRVSREGRA
jgi:hypothetical protein